MRIEIFEEMGEGLLPIFSQEVDVEVSVVPPIQGVSDFLVTNYSSKDLFLKLYEGNEE